MNNTGLFGGTFNPIHLGHLQVAADVRRAFALDDIVFIPSAVPPHKDAEGLVDARARYDMILAALSDAPGFIVSDMEIHRQGPSYTIDTVACFQDRLPRETVCYWMVGMDAFLEITTWKHWQRLFDLIPFIVMTRPENPAVSPSAAQEKLAAYIHAEVDRGYRHIPEKGCFLHKTRCPVFLTQVTPMDISSSDIRHRIRQGLSIRHLVPDGVADYIKQKGLYI